MPLFKISTSVELKVDDRNKIICEATAQIAQIIEKDVKLITIDFNDTTREDKDFVGCKIFFFDKYTKELETNLRKSAKVIGSLILKCPLSQNNFDVICRHYKNQVLVDWTEKSSVIASIPVESQGKRKCCWAYALACATSLNYSINNPSITDLAKILTSPQDLVDWEYSYIGLGEKRVVNGVTQPKIKIEENGTYGCNPAEAFPYVQEKGISLLENYKVEPDNKERCTATTFNESEFNEMVRSRGERIFIKGFNHIKREGNRMLNIELLTNILSKGVVHASMYYCNGQDCHTCTGFGSHKRGIVYDEKPHPPKHKYSKHSVVVVGVGNENGKDYLKIRNTWGPTWGNKGYAKVHLKFFTQIFQVLGTEKKKWTKSSEEWILTPTTN